MALINISLALGAVLFVAYHLVRAYSDSVSDGEDTGSSEVELGTRTSVGFDATESVGSEDVGEEESALPSSVSATTEASAVVETVSSEESVTVNTVTANVAVEGSATVDSVSVEPEATSIPVVVADVATEGRPVVISGFTDEISFALQRAEIDDDDEGAVRAVAVEAVEEVEPHITAPIRWLRKFIVYDNSEGDRYYFNMKLPFMAIRPGSGREVESPDWFGTLMHFCSLGGTPSSFILTDGLELMEFLKPKQSVVEVEAARVRFVANVIQLCLNQLPESEYAQIVFCGALVTPSLFFMALKAHATAYELWVAHPEEYKDDIMKQMEMMIKAVQPHVVKSLRSLKNYRSLSAFPTFEKARRFVEEFSPFRPLVPAPLMTLPNGNYFDPAPVIKKVQMFLMDNVELLAQLHDVELDWNDKDVQIRLNRASLYIWQMMGLALRI